MLAELTTADLLAQLTEQRENDVRARLNSLLEKVYTGDDA